MAPKLLIKLLLLCCSVMGYMQMQAQGWENKYSTDFMMAINTVYATKDSAYLVTGWNQSSTLPNTQRIMKIADNGNVLWKSDVDSLSTLSIGNITQDGGLIILSTTVQDSFGHISNYIVLRTDSDGQKLWEKTIFPEIPTGGEENTLDIDTTDDGGFIAAYTAIDSLIDTLYNDKIFLCRMDGQGNIIWKKSYFGGDSSGAVVYGLRNSKDGGFVITAFGIDSLSSSAFLFKVDSNGNLLWLYHPTQEFIIYFRPYITNDGNILLPLDNFLGGSGSLIKLNQQGIELWEQAYNWPGTSYWIGQVIEREDNTFALFSSAGNWLNTLSLTVVDTTGHVLLYKPIPTGNFGVNAGFYASWSRVNVLSHENGYVFGGWLSVEPQNYSGGFLIKMDSNGVVYPCTLSGNVFDDDHNNCIRDSSEIYLAPTFVTFAGEGDTFTVVTNDSGYYSVGLDTGNYGIQVALPSAYWQPSSCDPASVSLSSGADSILLLGLTPIVYSPYITINGCLSPALARCLQVTYYVEYCNTGTLPFTGVIQITVDTMLLVDSASTPWLTQTGNLYTFAVDTLDIMQCATLEMYCNTSCSAGFVGRTACVDAQASQDTILIAPPMWDRSNLDMDVNYNPSTDTITFTLKNPGTGNMNQPEELIVIEDNVILMNVPVQLVSGSQYIEQVRANGSTWRATIDQTPYNPYSKFVTAAIEGADTNQQGGVSLGYFTQFPYNGYTSYQYNTCNEILNSYDPNQKTVTPKGEGHEQLIDTSVRLEYSINFQNTGTAPANTVRVIDALSPYLDPSTIRLEVSSKPCQMQIIGTNTAVFTFNNINLPDSSVSQMGSTGFVKFGINQQAGNADGTVINNQADIYFDYNQPITTNTATVRIGQLTLTDVRSIYPSKSLLINAYPNPFNNSTLIKVTGETFSRLQLNVYDVTGRLIKQQGAQNTNQFILYRNDLESGSYVFEISTDGKSVGVGKIVVQ